MYVPLYKIMYTRHQKLFTIVTDLDETHILCYIKQLFLNSELLLTNLDNIPQQNAIKLPVLVK
jgi:hypothetical protein